VKLCRRSALLAGPAVFCLDVKNPWARNVMRSVQWAIVVGTLVCVGCQASASLPGNSPQVTPVAAESATGLKPADIKLVKGDAKSLAAMIAEHKGNVVFVDFWATWCGPCVEGFPHTVEISKKFKEQGVATIAISFDNLESEPAVREFLSKQGADFENLLSKYDGVNQEAAVDFAVDAVPQYRLYDRQGNQRYKWVGQSDEIEAKIQELLAEKR
jgi:thiol-disulfide isomerase/thioredoxin